MTNTLNLIGNRGATFTNCVSIKNAEIILSFLFGLVCKERIVVQFVATPVCCPNRASILTGRYQHTHLTVNNSVAGGCNSAQWRRLQEPTTFGSLLQNIIGYKTFYAGKYLNQVDSLFNDSSIKENFVLRCTRMIIRKNNFI